MKNKKIILLSILLVFSTISYAQRVRSEKKSVLITTGKIQRGIPPNLFANLEYSDDNNNGILESEESSVLKITITNKGKGRAQGLIVYIHDDLNDKNLIFTKNIKIGIIEPGNSRTIEIPISAKFNITRNKHKIKISVNEHFGYDMDPAYLKLSTMEYQQPKIVFSGLEIFDTGEGTMAIIEDNQVQKGEMVKVKVVIQNVGMNIAENVQLRIKSNDVDIYLENNNKKLGNMKVGEVKEVWLTLSPNKRVNCSGKLPLFLSVTEKKGFGNLSSYQLPIEFSQKPPKAEILDVTADYESLKKEVAVFEFNSKKFTANTKNTIDIARIEPVGNVIPNSVGVVIGIEEYKYMPNAPYAKNDAVLMKEYFKKRLGLEQVIIFTNNEVSGFIWDDIFNPETGELQKAVVKGETELYVFYSGHGVPQKDGKFAYLFPSDGKIDRLDKQGYQLEDFYNNLNELEAKNVTVFLDACFSGASRSSEKIEAENLTGTKAVIVRVNKPKPWLSNPNFTVFSSSTGTETSLGYDAAKTGLFSYFLMAGMQGLADTDENNEITLGELKNYVIKNVTEIAPKISGKQTPKFNGDENKIIIKY